MFISAPGRSINLSVSADYCFQELCPRHASYLQEGTIFMKSQHIHTKTNSDFEVWLYHHQTSDSFTVLLLYLLPCGKHAQS